MTTGAPTSEEFLDHLVDLAVQSGADRARATERMRQAAATYAVEVQLAYEQGQRDGAAARREVA